MTTVYDLRGFESKILPAWLDLFTVDFGNGVFSLDPSSAAADLYGTLDVVHVLGTCGHLDRLDENTRDLWKATIDSYQDPVTGDYKVSDDDPGRQPFHAAANSAAALAILDRRPAYPNRAFEALAITPANWSATLDPLYSSACYSSKLRGNNIHECAQQIGSYPATLAVAERNATFRPFVDWWVDWVRSNVDRRLGVVCPVSNTTLARVECVGGAMPTFGVMLGLDLGFRLPDPARLLAFALETQRETGGAWSDADPRQIGSLSLDGIFQVTRAALQLGTESALQAAKRSCTRLLDLTVPQISDPAFFFKTYANDSHALPNVVAAVAECAQTFPSLVNSTRPWSCCARYV